MSGRPPSDVVPVPGPAGGVALPPGPPDGITIRGGAGAAFADLAELRGAAHALRLAAERLDVAAAHVAGAGRSVASDEHVAPATARAATAALAPLLHGPTSLRAAADRTRELARSLQAAADLYSAAEDRAHDAVRAALVAVGAVVGDNPLVTALAALGAARLAMLAGVLALGWRAAHGERPPNLKDLVIAAPTQDAMLLLGSVVRGLAPGHQLLDPTPVPGAAGLVVAGLTAGSLFDPDLRRRPLRVTARLGSTLRPAPRDAADVLRDLGALYPEAGGTPGTIGVERLERADGSRAWVVAIPGTQAATDLGAGPNPMDMGTNLRLMAGTADDGTELVVRALDRAGVRPGEPVLLAGHSQGGMVAMALAGSAAFRARYTVAAVLTAGSRVASQVVPSTTPVLHLEHRQDLVPALDGRPSPAGENRTTAVRDLRSSSDPADRLAGHDPGAAHRIATYARTAAAVSATGAPSVRAWEAAADRVLGGPGTRAVRLEFTGTRPGSLSGGGRSPR